MGHCVNYFVVKDKKDIMPTAQEFASRNADREENPSGSYHGSMHILENQGPFKDRESAEEFIDERSSKGFYDDYAVRFYDTEAVRKTKKIETLEARIITNQKKEQEYTAEHSVAKLKAVKIGCKNCGSLIAKSYLRSEICPVCRTDLRADYIVERLKKFKTDSQKLMAEVRTERQKLIDKAPVKWLMNVQVHS